MLGPAVLPPLLAGRGQDQAAPRAMLSSDLWAKMNSSSSERLFCWVLGHGDKKTNVNIYGKKKTDIFSTVH